MGVLIVGAILTAEGVVAAHMIRHLHLDNIRAPVGKLAACGWPRPNLREIDNAKALERRGGGDVRHCCSRMTMNGTAIIVVRRFQSHCGSKRVLRYLSMA